jgi:hypothetical protein
MFRTAPRGRTPYQRMTGRHGCPPSSPRRVAPQPTGKECRSLRCALPLLRCFQAKLEQMAHGLRTRILSVTLHPSVNALHEIGRHPECHLRILSGRGAAAFLAYDSSWLHHARRPAHRPFMRVYGPRRVRVLVRPRPFGQQADPTLVPGRATSPCPRLI